MIEHVISQRAIDPTSKNRVIGGRRLGVLSIADQCVYSGTNFLTAVLIGRYAGASELGTYTLAFSITVLMISLQRSLLVAPYVVIRGSLSQRHHQGMRASMAKLSFALTCVGALVCLIVAAITSNLVILALSIALSGGLSRDYLRRIAMSDYQYNRVIGVDMAVAMAQIGGLLMMIYTDFSGWTLTAPIALIWCGLVWMLVALAAAMLGSPLPSSGQNEDTTEARSTFDYLRLLWPTGRWISLTQVISTLQAYAIPWVIAISQSLELAGIYAACWTMVQVISPAIEGRCNLLEPALASAALESSMQSFRRVVRSVTWLFVVLMGGLVIVAIGWGDVLLTLSYGESYASYQSVLVLLTVASAIGNISIPANKALIQLGWALANSIVAGGSLVLTVAAALMCLHWMGPDGAAWGLLLGTSFGLVSRWILLRKAVKDV